MTILRLIEVSAASARAAIDTASADPDPDAIVMRVGVLEFLRLHASRVEAQGDDAELLQAYREWLDMAAGMFSTGREDLVREYMRSAGVFSAELELAQARADGRIAASQTAA